MQAHEAWVGLTPHNHARLLVLWHLVSVKSLEGGSLGFDWVSTRHFNWRSRSLRNLWLLSWKNTNVLLHESSCFLLKLILCAIDIEHSLLRFNHKIVHVLDFNRFLFLRLRKCRITNFFKLRVYDVEILLQKLILGGCWCSYHLNWFLFLCYFLFMSNSLINFIFAVYSCWVGVFFLKCLTSFSNVEARLSYELLKKDFLSICPILFFAFRFIIGSNFLHLLERFVKQMEIRVFWRCSVLRHLSRVFSTFEIISKLGVCFLLVLFRIRMVVFSGSFWEQ